MEQYNHKKIEPKWAKKWEEDKLYQTPDVVEGKENFYALSEFAYPSGNLHVGHWYAFAVPDIYARFKRMQGYNVLYPAGFDSFGLPAENAAIKRGVDPRQWTYDNMDYMRKQLRSMGAMFDWSREIITSDPEYYRWTQWIFTKMFEKGLAYKAETKVNWCPSCKTVLANEQVVGGLCERCDSEIERKTQEQWMLKITEYAESLLSDLDNLEWPEQIKEMQRNWIGKSQGAEFQFPISNIQTPIKVFTTRPDTLFGVTYLVLSPEHKLLNSLREDIKNWKEVEIYIKDAGKKSDIERQAEGKEKTGVLLEGITAKHPATGQDLPIYIADYVLATYGTGAIMAVPAHDQRDFEFAQKFDLPIKYVVAPSCQDHANPHVEGKELSHRNALIAIVHDPKEDKYLCLKWKDQPWTTFVTGGIDEGEVPLDAAKREVLEETGYADIELIQMCGKTRSEFFAAHKDINRIATNDIFLFELKSNEKQEVDSKELAQHDPVWLTSDEIEKVGLQHAELDFIWKWIKEKPKARLEEGVVVGSGEFDGLEILEATKKITEKYGSFKTTYKLRDWSVGRQRYWGTPIPVVFDPQGNPHPVPEENLPWLLPNDVDVTPTGEPPLAKSAELLERTEKIFGKDWKPEVETMDTFIDSSWYFLRYLDSKNDSELSSKEIQGKWMPVDQYFGGSEHTTLHLLYSRFFQKVLFDLGVVNEKEPFKKRLNRGLILGPDGAKMSKSKGNVIDPDEVVERVGADTVRMYLAFIGPYGESGSFPWDMGGIAGLRRFLERVWYLRNSLSDAEDAEVESLLHKTISKVHKDNENFKFNTAISAMMVLLNLSEKKGITETQYKIFLRILAPFAPHITEELWCSLEDKSSIHLMSWPEVDSAKLVESTMTIAVQIDGKIRATLSLPAGISEEELRNIIDQEEPLSKWLTEGYEVKKIVPGRLVSIVNSTNA